MQQELPLRLIAEARTIAVVGASSDPRKASNSVMRYLMDAGYTVYAVNPDETEVHGLHAYASLAEVPVPIDLVDVFRRPQFVPAVVASAIEVGAKAVWLQTGIVHEGAAAQARAAGLEVVMDRCTRVEHQRLRRG